MQKSYEIQNAHSNEAIQETIFSCTQRRLALCFNYLLCCCKSSSAIAPQEGPEEHKDFWEGFIRAFSALENPVILGEIQRGTLDVNIIYANQAAEKFTGYRNCKFNEDNPTGIIGRSVTHLMPDDRAPLHRRYVNNWLRGPDTIELHSDHSNMSTTTDRLGSIEGKRRKTRIKIANGDVITTNATLSFFSPKGRGNRVVGIFSIEQCSKLPELFLGSLSIKMKYTDPTNNRKSALIINTPEYLSEFSDDEKWSFRQIGGSPSEEIKKTCKDIIYKQFTDKLCNCTTPNSLQLVTINRDGEDMTKESAADLRERVIYEINANSNEENMHINILNYVDNTLLNDETEISTFRPSFKQG